MIVDFTPGERFLEETLVRAATDPAARPEFHRRLLAAELLPPDGGDRGSPTGRRRRQGASGREALHLGVAQRPFTFRCSRRARASTRLGGLRERSYGFLALSGKAAFARLAQEKQAAFLNSRASRAASSSSPT